MNPHFQISLLLLLSFIIICMIILLIFLILFYRKFSDFNDTTSAVEKHIDYALKHATELKTKLNTILPM